MTGKYVQLIFLPKNLSISKHMTLKNRVICKNMTLTILKFNLPGSGKTAAFLVPMLSRIYEEGPFENAVRIIYIYIYFVYLVLLFSF